MNSYVNYMTNLTKGVFYNLSQNTQIFVTKEKMKFQRIITNFNPKLYAEKHNFSLDETSLSNSGFFIFYDNDEIKAIYDLTTQTLNTNDKDLL